MANYEDIKKANEALKTTDVKGKPYIEVNQRIKAFRMVYPEGFIITGMLSNENGVCVFNASVGVYANGEPFTLGTGTAYEKEGSSFINETSYIENAETSAVGRALGMAGFGIDTAVASAEEVQNAINNQGGGRKATQKQIDLIRRLYGDDNIPGLLFHYKVNRLEDLTMKQASDLISAIKKEGH